MIEQIQTTSKWKVALIGESGSGKTHLAGTAALHPDLAPVLFLDFEGGTDSVVHIVQQHPGSIQVEKIKSIDHLEEVFWKLQAGEDEYAKFNTIILDSATEMQSLDLTNIVQEAMKLPKHKHRTIDEVYLEDYGKSTKRLSRIFRNFRNLDKHVVFTCLVNFKTTESGHVMSADANLTGKLAKSFRGFMSYVWYIYTTYDSNSQSEKRYMLTENNGIMPCKTRGLAFNQMLKEKYQHMVPENSLNLAYLYEEYKRLQGGDNNE